MNMRQHTDHITHKSAVKNSFNPRLKRMLQLYLLIAFVLLVYVGFSSLKNGANLFYVLIGLVVGVGIGFIFARIFKISWDANAEQVIYRMDIVGVILLVIFIVFDFTKSDLVSSVISGPSVKPTSFALLAGTLYGRVIMSRRSIISVLREQKIIPTRKAKNP